jgi:hypothetical protein
MSEEEIREYSIEENPTNSLSEFIKISIKASSSSENLNAWMPFVKERIFFPETYPVKTSFSAPRDKIDEVISIMNQHGYQRVTSV